MVKKEWKSLFKNPFLMIVLAAILLIPSIYSTLFLASMWDPYGQLEKLPVAVVNEDQSVTYKGKTLAVGEELVKNLKEEASLDFHFVDQKKADKGIHSGKYYMVLTIPENFSEHATTLMDAHPKQMKLEYATNPGTNYIASKLSNTALEKIKNAVADEVTRTYAKTVFDQLKEIEDGMDEGADGAKQLYDGSSQLLDGNQQIADNLKVLADSSLVFKDGSQTLERGLKEYTEGVESIAKGANTLKNGTKDLKEGSDTLSTGTKQIQAASSKLHQGVKSYISGVNGLKNGADQLAGLTQIDQVYDGIHTMKLAVNDGSEQAPSLKVATGKLAAGLATLDEQMSELSRQLSSQTGNADITVANQIKNNNRIIQKQNQAMAQSVHSIDDILQTKELDPETRSALENARALLKESQSEQLEMIALPEDKNQAMSEAVAALAGGVHNSSLAASQIENGTRTLAEGLKGLDQATGSFPAAAAGMKQLMAGFGTLTNQNALLLNGEDQLSGGMQTLVEGAGRLDQGAYALDQGAAALNSGAKKLESNSPKLVAGSSALTDGALKIHDGAGQLAKGSAQVQDGLGKVQDGSKELADALSDGAEEIKENEASDKTLDMFATPVTAKETQITTVPNNGSAMSAYMMCVGLWVGALAFCLMYPLVEYDGKVKSGISWWLSKASVAYPIAIIMALIMLGALHIFCGFAPLDLGKTIAIACIASCTFMTIMYFFNVALGKVGSFIMLIFMVVQLAGSAGTYPIEISAGFVAKIHKYLPFSYVVEAFRMGICGEGHIGHAVYVLSIWLLVFAGFTILLFDRHAKKLEASQE